MQELFNFGICLLQQLANRAISYSFGGIWFFALIMWQFNIRKPCCTFVALTGTNGHEHLDLTPKKFVEDMANHRVRK